MKRKILLLFISVIVLALLTTMLLVSCGSNDTEDQQIPAPEPDDGSTDTDDGSTDTDDGDGTNENEPDDGNSGTGNESEKDEENGEQAGGSDTEDPNEGNSPEKPVYNENSLILIDDGVVNFKFVYDTVDYDPETKSEIISILQRLESENIITSIVYDGNPNTVQDCEILVGEVENRDDYRIDVHEFGEEGYTIRVVDDKVIIIGGTAKSTAEAVKYFGENCLTLYNNSYKYLTVDRALNITVKQKYDIESVSIAGNDISDYSIYCDESDIFGQNGATALQTALYKNTGYWLNITFDEGGKQIKFVKEKKDVQKDSFSVSVVGNNLLISNQYPYLTEKNITDFLAEKLGEQVKGELAFENNYYYGYADHYIYYADFGAVGDGVTDDFTAIMNAHGVANLTGQTVIAESGKTYNMGAYSTTIYIRSDTVWTGASFIIDDSQISPNSSTSRTFVFTVSPSRSAKHISNIKSLSKDATNVGTFFDGKYLLVIENSNVKQYIRYGVNADNGASQQEILLVHPDGSIDPSTPVLWDYDTVTSAVAYYADETPLSIVGGTFTTIANQAEREYTYYARGINVNRSNVTVTGLKHLIIGEGPNGAPYHGFLSVNLANNVLFENIVYSGHKTYKLKTNSSNSMGTYDISASLSNAVTWRGCTQANSIYDTSLWGVMGSNYCKNLTYDSCQLSRFDAHKGMYNATVINSEIGHVGINAIGAGTLLIQNTVINANHVVNLRSDYGSTWDGDVIIKDVTLNNKSSASIFNAGWNNHYFGYTCYLPKNVTIDNIKIATGTNITVFPSFGGKDIGQPGTKNPVVVTESIVIRNNKNNYTFTLSSNKTAFANTTLTVQP